MPYSGYAIPFNKPFIVGKELHYIAQAVSLGNIAADGHFTRSCSEFFEKSYGIHRALMTPSCTAALEMAAMLCNLEPGDEVILPSYTFVSTASAIVRAGARPVFVDVRPDTMNLDEEKIEDAITPRTRGIVPVHYAGVSCEMNRILEIASARDLFVFEDAAQGVNAFYEGRPLGSLGSMGTYSFHETKNFIAGEGGALCINDPALVERAEILRDKGTNRQAFFRGEVDKYTWVELGSSYVPSEICCAFLYAQLEQAESIGVRRREIYEAYEQALTPMAAEGRLELPTIPANCRTNYHMFYVLLESGEERDALMDYLKERGVLAVFHYMPLHLSPVGRGFGYDDGDLPVTERNSLRLLRLPFYFELTQEEQDTVVGHVRKFLSQATPRRRGQADLPPSSPSLSARA